ncbi:hypothetical protein HUG10_21120 (plasmid) [Halorarum halophilum]|uniref:Uncharacterized protein n=1 Tax=Halorarum halophilum TaxID=2743090 RepID=A0A7D5GIQ6_9EURY|nr:hypothetical protein [Halobaculum halophilum]QLG30090.1 hypothetical protein HUG10_21120 [Halobaculum halophilum]
MSEQFALVDADGRVVHVYDKGDERVETWGGDIAQVVIAPTDMTDPVPVPTDAAEVARRELDILIRQTGGDAGFDVPEYDIVEESMTPLAMLKLALESEAESLDVGGQSDFGRGKRAGLEYAVELLEGVADVTGSETSRIDPLQDDIFRALGAFKDVTVDPDEIVYTLSGGEE